MEEEIHDYQVVNEENRKSLESLQKELNVANGNLAKYNQDKTTILSSLKPVKDNLDTIDVTGWDLSRTKTLRETRCVENPYG